MKLLKPRVLYSLLLIVAVIGVIALIMIKGPLAPITVNTTRLQTGDLKPAVFGVGTVQARRSYNIGFTRAGRLLSLMVDQGDRVERGQLLGKMDPVDLPQRIRSADLLLQKTEHLVLASEAAVREARERAEQAQREMLRYQKLAKQKQVSQELADTRASDARAAEDKVAEAEATLDAVRHDFERMQEDIKALNVQLNELSLLSPASGVISARNLEPGSVVGAGVAVLNLIEPQSLWVQVRIDQAASGAIQKGQTVAIELRHQAGRIFSGRVDRIEMVADSLTEERLIDVAFDDIPQDISIGMLANATIALPSVKQAQWLPAAAVAYQQGKPGVWRIEQDKVVFAPVKTGVKTLDGKVQITDGLSAQDEIVLYAAKPLQAGSKVKPQAVANHHD